MLRALKDCMDWERVVGQQAAQKLWGKGGRAEAKGLCGRCAITLREWVAETRQALWGKLPEFFELQ